MEYNNFRDVLLLLLAGNLTDDQVDPIAESNGHLNRFHNGTFDVSTPKKNISNQKSISFYEDDRSRFEQESFQNKRNSVSSDSGQDWLLIDFTSDIDDNSSPKYPERSPAQHRTENDIRPQRNSTIPLTLNEEIFENIPE